MLLEKVSFLENAIEVAVNEIKEEILAIEERGNGDEGHLAILKTLEDLLSTAKHFEMFDIESASDSVEGESVETKKINFDDYLSDSKYHVKYRFNQGDEVIITDRGYFLSNNDHFSRLFGIKERKLFETPDAENGKKALLLARQIDTIEPFIPVYLVLQNGKLFVGVNSAFSKV